jgi:hypothetical protein
LRKALFGTVMLLLLPRNMDFISVGKLMGYYSLKPNLSVSED